MPLYSLTIIPWGFNYQGQVVLHGHYHQETCSFVGEEGSEYWFRALR